MVELLKKNDKYCSGCGACYNICPVQAISMEKDPQGFLYPVINRTLCVNCKKCERVCPKLFADTSNRMEPDCYAARGPDDIRAVSSSGGIFTLLAHHILAQGGVVCGAAMEEDYSVHHICVDSESGLDRLRKSKYVQSDTGRIYEEVAQHLKAGRKVLFTGCPCQVAAAKNYIGADRSNIYFVDILCHGVPSVQMWQDYLHESFDLSKVRTVEFRSKLNGWRSDQLRIFWHDGSSKPVPWPESAYEEGFQRNISLRDGCNECEFCGHQRQGDLTMGDFWRVEQHDQALNDHKGTSVVLVNNEIGQELLDAISPNLIDLTRTPIDAARFNRLTPYCHSHPQRERFKTLYPGHSFSDAVMQCRHSLYDIGLVGIYTTANYGAHLTYYALYKALTDQGYSVLMITSPKDALAQPADDPVLFARNPYPKWAQSRRFANIAEMKFLNNQCKAFVVGSDQLFNNNLYNNYNKFMALNFVGDNHPKIAYAASCGHDRIWGSESDRAEESFYLQKFDAFSVREKAGVELFRREFGVNQAVCVLDPVFLMDQADYQALVSAEHQNTPATPYLFAYVLDPTPEKEKILNLYAKKYNLDIRAVSDAHNPKKKPNWEIETLPQIKMESWLAHIADSDFVITDSFHGMCVAIIFKKQFMAIINKHRGEARFTTILQLLGLEDHGVYSMEQLEKALDTVQPIDYTAVDAKLHQEKMRSLRWLRDAIENNKNKKAPFSTFNILDARIDELSERICALENSRSYRIGRAVTWLPRKIRGGIRCLRDNGLRYTIRRIGEKIRNKLV